MAEAVAAPNPTTSQPALGEPTSVARRRLRVAQQAFRAADALANAGLTDADRVATVVQLDFVVETVLRTVLFEARHSKARIESFRDLLGAVAETLGSAARAFAGCAGLEQVRAVRNAAQHEARVPTPNEVIECVVHTRDAVIDITNRAWGIDFFASDTEAIRSERARGYLARAEMSREFNDLHGAMGWIRTAFHFAFTNGGENVVGPEVSARALSVSDSFTPSSFAKRDGESAAIALRRLQVLGRLTAFGMNVREYVYWRNKLLPAPNLGLNGELIRHEAEEDPWLPDDYTSAFSYVVDSILRMEQVVEDVLGRDRKGRSCRSVAVILVTPVRAEAFTKAAQSLTGGR
jgi:hypothetical protein